MRVTVTTRGRLVPTVRSYAEQKLQRLERHAHLHDINMVIEHEEHKIPPCSAEVILHLSQSRVAAKADGHTAQEAVDLAVSKADRQVTRLKDRAVDHRAQLW
jgi:ribosomal subunit interface protein